MARKGTSRKVPSKSSPISTCCETANSSLSPKHGGGDNHVEDHGPSPSAVIKLTETVQAETCCSMGTLQSTVGSFGSRLVVETSLQSCDKRITALESKCETLEKCNNNRYQNLCMFGVPENLEDPQVTLLMTAFLAEMLGRHQSHHPIAVELFGVQGLWHGDYAGCLPQLWHSHQLQAQVGVILKDPTQLVCAGRILGLMPFEAVTFLACALLTWCVEKGSLEQGGCVLLGVAEGKCTGQDMSRLCWVAVM